MYFTSAYVTLRVLRQLVNCTLPIEIFYVGNQEMPPAAVDHMHETYDARFIDITAFPEARNVNLQGYQLKAFSILLSSFEEVLWMDSDNIPLADPAELFDSQLYTHHGAVFWPDFCNMVSFRPETLGVFGLPDRPHQPQPRENKTTVWPPRCHEDVPVELETGQVLLHKARTWDGLRMAVYLNRHHAFFFKRLFRGDKMTFHFGFVAAKAQYSLVPFLPGGMGIRSKVIGQDGVSRSYMCANTMVQHHPDTGTMFFLHRTMAKYKDAHSYVNKLGPYRAWSHAVYQQPKDSWALLFRDELPPAFFLGDSSGIHHECLHPTALTAKVSVAPPWVQHTESVCLGFLRDLQDLPFYPKNRQCTTESLFFCKHP